jgi:hypothetical protein
MNLERRPDPFRRPAHMLATRRMNARSAGQIDGSDWAARTGSVLPSLDELDRVDVVLNPPQAIALLQGRSRRRQTVEVIDW